MSKKIYFSNSFFLEGTSKPIIKLHNSHYVHRTLLHKFKMPLEENLSNFSNKMVYSYIYPYIWLNPALVSQISCAWCFLTTKILLDIKSFFPINKYKGKKEFETLFHRGKCNWYNKVCIATGFPFGVFSIFHMQMKSILDPDTIMTYVCCQVTDVTTILQLPPEKKRGKTTLQGQPQPSILKIPFLDWLNSNWK